MQAEGKEGILGEPGPLCQENNSVLEAVFTNNNLYCLVLSGVTKVLFLTVRQTERRDFE